MVVLIGVIGLALAAVLLFHTMRRRGDEPSTPGLAAPRVTPVPMRIDQRLDPVLRASGVTVTAQDRDLRFTWVSQEIFGVAAGEILGRTEPEAFPGVDLGPMLELKRGVLESGQPARADVRVVHQGADAWFDLAVHPVTDATGATTGIITSAIDITRHKEQDANVRKLMRELTHRSKNLLSVTQAIMRQTATNSTSMEDFEARFAARLDSLAGSHELLVREDWRGASLSELVRSQLGHYVDLEGPRLELDGEPVYLDSDAAQHIGMAMHELATNAAKFGALSVPAGKIRIAWGPAGESGGEDDGPRWQISWVESGGPLVEPPTRRGFGRVVVERTVGRAVLGEVTVDYDPDGLRWTLIFPATFIITAGGS